MVQLGDNDFDSAAAASEMLVTAVAYDITPPSSVSFLLF
jgi:hypothetical protein